MEGLPSNIRLDFDFIDNELKRRQGGYGRGGRMKIEKDQVRFLSGVRHGKTLGSPIAMMIENRDWPNWEETMSAQEVSAEAAAKRTGTRPRPGHTDLAGSLKFNQTDARNILERSSARETTARVAAGGLAKVFLRNFRNRDSEPYHRDRNWQVYRRTLPFPGNSSKPCATDDVVRCALPDVGAQMVSEIEKAQKEGDTIGGTFEVIARGVPTGLGSHTAWDTRLDGQLAQAIMSINAVKAVEFGRRRQCRHTARDPMLTTKLPGTPTESVFIV